jgi:hypothetical protein
MKMKSLSRRKSPRPHLPLWQLPLLPLPVAQMAPLYAPQPQFAEPGWPDSRDPVAHREAQLDKALEDSFPASDPIACYRCN